MAEVNKIFQVAYVAKKRDGSRAVDAKERTVEGWASKPIIDRDDELIEWNAWELENFNNNPVFMPFHDYSKNPVGRVLWTKTTEDGLLFKTKFADKGTSELADEMFSLYDQGIMNAFSVGFRPMKWVDAKDAGEPKRRYTQAELLEISGVGLPSCTTALVAAYENGGIKETQLQEHIRSDAIIKGMLTKKEERLEDGAMEDEMVIERRDFEDDLELKEGRVISAKTRKQLTTTRNATSTATELIDALLEEPAVTTEDAETDKAMTKATGMWNKTLPKSFDIAEYDQANTVFRYELFTKFLECQVKEIYVNSYDIPSPLVGTYLESISVVTAGMNIDDTRRFSYDGKESPPRRDYIQLNSEKRKRFLTNGSEYCHDGEMALVKDFSPGWRGLEFAIVTSTENEEKSDEIMNAIHAEADTNHMLKGEKFALSGEFLPDTDDSWDDLVIATKDRQAIQKSMKITRDADGKSRGLMFVGPPGTGKTKAGRTIMNDTESTFIWVSARDFMYGWPDQILALAFDMSRKLAPTVLFMEDVDTSLDKDLLKTELDGLKQNKGIMTILTTNHPDRLPKALIDRPGRFHHILLFDLPDAGQRKEMFKLWAGDIEAKILDVLVDSTDGFSGAHIYHLVEYSQDIAEAEELTIGKALLESLLRMTDQIELVEGLSTTQTKELFNEKDLRQSADDEVEITPELAQWLLEQDDQEKQAAEDGAPLTAAEKLLIATNHYV